MDVLLLLFFFFFIQPGWTAESGCEQWKDCPTCIRFCYWTFHTGGFPAMCIGNPDHSPYPVYFAISPHGDCSQHPDGRTEAASSTRPSGGYTSLELWLVAVLCLLLGGLLVWGFQRAQRRWQLWRVAGILEQANEVEVQPRNPYQNLAENQVRRAAAMLMPAVEDQQHPRAEQILMEMVRNNPNLNPPAEPPRRAGPNPFIYPEQLAIDMGEDGVVPQPLVEDRVPVLPDVGSGTGSLRSKAKKRTQLELLIEAQENSVHGGEILGVRLRSQAH